jgi:hypothetical protein
MRLGGKSFDHKSIRKTEGVRRFTFILPRCWLLDGLIICSDQPCACTKCHCGPRTDHRFEGSARATDARSFQADEGDRWMLLGGKPLIFKVDPLSTASDTLVVGTEEVPPGNKIPTHMQLREDERSSSNLLNLESC